jgi:transcriptional regulator with XRE-family HTH domain
MSALSLGEKINKHRVEKKLSLDKLAAIAEVSKSYLWELENPRAGKKPLKPSAEVLTKIAAALDVTTDYLLDEKATADTEVLQEAFFRKFNQLEPEDQEKFKQMLDLWNKKK